MITRVLSLSAFATIAAALPAQLAGTYAVGPAGNFANMAAAVTALNTQGVSAPVTFLVLANDTGPWTINAFPGQGPSNPVVFDGLGTATLSGAPSVLTLNGCSSVSLQGFTGTFAAGTAFTSAPGTSDCSFRNCSLLSTVATSGAPFIHLVGGTRFVIEDCEFGGSYDAIYVTTGASNTTIRRNKILGGGFWTLRLEGPDAVLENNFISGASNYGIRCAGLNVKVLHNSVFINHPTTSSQYCSIRWYAAATSATEVRNNIFCDNYATGAGALNMWCSGALRPAVMDNNCFWSNIAGYNCVFAGTNLQFSGWQALGFDLNGIQRDPQFVSPVNNTSADLRIQDGSPCKTAGTPMATTPLDYFNMPRTLPVSIGAHENDNASYTVFGAGCPGSAGTPTNSTSNPPQIGSAMTITFGNLPTPELAIAVIGFSNTTSPLGALPFDMTGLGAPGCSARISPDMTIFLFGSSGAAQFALSTPNQPALLGLTYYTQGLVLDSGNNALGVSMSSAAAAFVGL